MTEVLPAPTDSKQDELARLLLLEGDKTPLKQLALQAGYSESSSESTVYTLVKSDSFQNKLIALYKVSTTEQLPKCLKIREKALEKYLDNPLLAIDKPKLLESTERIAGVHNEEKVRVPTINIGRLQILMQEMHNQPVKVIERVPEAEIAEG